MRTMLLSFKPEWFDKIKEGNKIFEYRRTFPDEEIMAYMYVSIWKNVTYRRTGY